MKGAHTDELIAVQRRPHLAKKIPIVASATCNYNEQRLKAKWEGTTPQGRELIRKKLWEVKRELIGAGFDKPWSDIAAMFPADLFSAALSVQDKDILERMSGHLTRTGRWPTFRSSVNQAGKLFDAIKWWPNYIGHTNLIESFKRIADDYEHVSQSAASGGSEKIDFAD